MAQIKIRGNTQIEDLSITNAQISTTADIARTKIASGTASRVVVNDPSGVLSDSTITTTELGHLSGVTDNIQTQLNGKLSYSSLNFNVAPTGSIDGVNTTFTLGTDIYSDTQLLVFLNGILQKPTDHYTVANSNQIVFSEAPGIGDQLLVFYTDDSAGGVPGTPPSIISSLNGQTGSTQTFATGTTGVDFNISSAGDVHTFNIPDASASSRGLITTSSQSIAGVKTFTSAPILSSLAVSQPLKLNASGEVISGFIDVSTEITGTLGLANGGTGETTRQAAINSLTDVASASTGQILKKVGSDVVFADDMETGTVQTVDATLTTVLSLPIPDDTTQSAVVLVSGKGPTGKHLWSVIHCGAYREGTGSAALIGVPMESRDEVGAGTNLWSVSIAVSGNNLLVQVTGDAVDAVNWTAKATR